MAKAGRVSAIARSSHEGTAARLIEAAIQSLQHDGFAGASARAIAGRAGCNQALIFYHFGSVTNLLLAALDQTSRQRMERYGPAVESASTLGELITVAGVIYREDLEAGHIAVLAELIAGASATPGLGVEVSRRVTPWIDFVQATLQRVLATTPFAQLLPARESAYAIVALYLGVEMLSHLDDDRALAESLLAAGTRLSATLGLAVTPVGQVRSQP
jgi:AcrR family transcriptional regulator